MTDATQQTASKAPTHIVYHVRENNDKGYWTKIGVAWSHKDQKGFRVQADFVPLDGRLTLRVASDKKD